MSVKNIIRKATLEDVQDIQKLVNEEAKKGIMLALSLSEIYEQVRDFYIFERDGKVSGTCALHISWDNLAEIRSLTVMDDYKRRGFGRRLVEACLEEARGIGIKRVFVLTYQGDFFKKLGFKAVEKLDLPHKIWKDCLKCVKFPDCDEEAFLIDME